MSDLRIALVAEGATDLVIIEAALRAILPCPFVLTYQPPERTRPDLGEGWGKVMKWCREFHVRGYIALENDPTLDLFDMVILHLDADVADKSYANYGSDVVQMAQQDGLLPLPCPEPCPPASATIDNLKIVLLSWLGIKNIGSKSVFCIPSKSSEAWLAAAVFFDNADLLKELECNNKMEARLKSLSKNQRIKKTSRDYQRHASSISNRWSTVREICTQAEIFHTDLNAIVQRMAP